MDARPFRRNAARVPNAKCLPDTQVRRPSNYLLDARELRPGHARVGASRNAAKVPGGFGPGASTYRRMSSIKSSSLNRRPTPLPPGLPVVASSIVSAISLSRMSPPFPRGRRRQSKRGRLARTGLNGCASQPRNPQIVVVVGGLPPPSFTTKGQGPVRERLHELHRLVEAQSPVASPRAFCILYASPCGNTRMSPLL